MTLATSNQLFRIILPLLLLTGGAVPFYAQNPPDTTAFQLPEELDEVVVIAYGTAKRKDFVGSVSSVRLENSPIALMNNSNALETLRATWPASTSAPLTTPAASPRCRCAASAPSPAPTPR